MASLSSFFRCRHTMASCCTVLLILIIHYRFFCFSVSLYLIGYGKIFHLGLKMVQFSHDEITLLRALLRWVCYKENIRQATPIVIFSVILLKSFISLLSLSSSERTVALLFHVALKCLAVRTLINCN